MIHELLSIALIAAIAAALYVLFLTSLTWAVELRMNLLNSTVRSYNASAICHTCGTNFMENCNVEDGKCQICGRILCSRCGLEWICPLCNKKRAEKGKKISSEIQAQEKLVAAKIMGLLKMKQYSTKSNMGYNKEFSIDEKNINNFPRASYSSNYGGMSILFPEYGVDLPNGSLPEYLKEGQPPKLKNWEENWLFKKKSSTEVFKPLAMFLPSPNQNSTAQIGDVDIEDLSELSEYSDSEIDSILN